MKTIFTPIAFSSFFLLATSLNAQITSSSQWTWINGANTGNQAGTYGTLGVPSAVNRPGARGGGAGSWKDAAGNFYLFGGYDPSNTYLNDLWKYNPSQNIWTWINGSNIPSQPGIYGTQGIASATNTPGGRYESVTWTDAAGNFWLFGGYGHPAVLVGGYANLNDLWKYNHASNQWTWVNGANTNNQAGVYGTLGTPSAANHPGARYSSTSWTDASGNLWLFGGNVFSATGTDYFNDLWKYNPSTNQWTWVNGANTVNQAGVYGTQGIPDVANRPGARRESAGWTDASGNFWLFGGTNYTGSSDFLNDLWKYNPTTNQWTWVSGATTANQIGVYGTRGIPAATNRPGARAGGWSNWIDGSGNLYLFGTYGYATSTSAGYLNDIWQYNPSSNQWTWINGASTTAQAGTYGTLGTAAPTNQPGARSPAALWTDATGNMWLLGGASGSSIGFLNDLWKLSITTALPITLSTVKAYQQNNNIAVEWKTQNESNIKQYEIEKSADGISFTKVAVQPALVSNNMSSNTYQWLDGQVLPSNNFYRVRSIFTSGETRYSSIVKVAVGKGKVAYVVYPNPISNGTIQLQFINGLKGTYSVQLLDTYGHVILTGLITHEGGSSTQPLYLNNSISKGNYTLLITAPDKSRQTIGIIN
jgi:N-acetylneuraminic acid mutarotase